MPRGFAPVVLVWMAAATASADGVAIEHRGLDCIVAEGFPKLEACLAPAADVARARVYFRAEAGSAWYYVDMEPVGACHAGVLPRPKASAGRVRYYIAAVDRGFAESRTEEFTPIVVRSSGECSGESVPALLKQATVKVGTAAGGPLVPAGFAAAGILGAGTSTAVVATAVAGAGAAVAGGAVLGSGGSTDTTVPTTVAASSTTTTRPTAPVPTTTQAPAPTTTTTLRPTTTTRTDCADKVDPVVQITSPADKSTVSGQVTIAADATDDTGVEQVRFLVDGRLLSTDTSSPYAASWDTSSVANGEHKIRVEARDRCDNDADDDVEVDVANPGAPTAAVLTWASRLEGAEAGQVVLNGSVAVAQGSGAAAGSHAACGRAGRVEAVVVRTSGARGSWSFRLGGCYEAGSLRVVAGDTLLVTADAVTFRLRGVDGERVVFAFRTR